MSPSDSLDSICRERLQKYCSTHPDHVLPFPFEQSVMELVEIIARNLRPRAKAASRFEHWKKMHANAPTLTDYCDVVILHWSESRTHIRRLTAGDVEEAAKFLRLAQAVAAKFDSDPAFQAKDFAQSAWEKIHAAPFPYDVPFDAWAGTIITHLALKTIQKHKRGSGALKSLDDRARSDDDTPGRSLDEQIRQDAPDAFQQIDDRDFLLRALKMLSQRRQQVIVMTFFEQQSDEEIARILKTKAKNVQVLRSRALDDLRNILETLK